MNEVSWNLFLLFRYSGWIFLLLLLLLVLPRIWFNITKIVKRIPRISISLVLIYYHILEVGTARANAESELKNSAVSHYCSFLHFLKTHNFLMLDNRHLKAKMIPSPSWYSILEEGFSGSVCILKILYVCMSKDDYLLPSSVTWAGLKTEKGRDFTFTVACAEIYWTLCASR